jgi:hypothetical protein
MSSGPLVVTGERARRVLLSFWHPAIAHEDVVSISIGLFPQL